MSSGFTKNYHGEAFKVVGKMNPTERATASMFPKVKDNIGIFVDYYRVAHDSGYHNDLYLTHYDNGLVGFDCSDRVDTVEDAYRLVESKRSIVNNWYCGFGIRRTTYNRETGEYTHEIIKPCEAVNCVIVDHLD